LILSTVAAAGASYLATRGEPIVYQARTTLMIGGTINDPNPSTSEFALGEQLAAAYADIASRELVRQATMAKLGVTRLPDYIARALPKTQIMEIIVSDRDPSRAQQVANELAAQLIQLSPTNLDPEEESRLEFVNQQLDVIESRLDETESQIEALKIQLGELDSVQEITNAQNQISALQTVLNTLHNTYANLLASTNQEAINSLTVIEPAALPSRPIGTNQTITILISAAVGFALAISAAYLLEYILDTSLKFPDEVERAFNSEIIGHFFTPSWLTRKKPPVLLTDDAPHPSAEAYRSLKTNLLLMDKNAGLKTILVASPEKQKGKTQLAINLALSLASGDRKVVLVDADLRLPSVHTVLALPNEKGLGDILTDQATLESVIHSLKDGKLSVITAGMTPHDLVERLDTPKMDEILYQLREMADIIILDAPPFYVADTSILASKVDGLVAVIRPGFSKKAAAINMAEQINRSHAKLLGITLNNIPSWGGAYYAKISNNHYSAT
ncbi:MAG: polysaccharide biosynthesis tyrosine autokinase, partial [Anaerolineales bacterium]|nr:polysaccharide biosynthesis tyrosine autokinase [Anaerolineales bacterium]